MAKARIMSEPSALRSPLRNVIRAQKPGAHRAMNLRFLIAFGSKVMMHFFGEEYARVGEPQTQKADPADAVLL